MNVGIDEKKSFVDVNQSFVPNSRFSELQNMRNVPVIARRTAMFSQLVPY